MSSGDPFHANALRSYIGRFTFKNDPLDVALRKLLMEVGLPRETQQIDRVVEAFATRYVQSNTNLFTSDGEIFILPSSPSVTLMLSSQITHMSSHSA